MLTVAYKDILKSEAKALSEGNITGKNIMKDGFIIIALIGL